jgi:hypothetical protein
MNGVEMTDAAQKSIEPEKESQLTPPDSHLAGFEPEILAFCCEH